MILHKSLASGCVIESEKPFILKGFFADGNVKAELINEAGTIIQQAECSPLENGEFQLSFNGQKASYEKYKIIVTDAKESITLSGILFGKVYLFGGQSNMSYAISAVENGANYIDEFKKDAFIRFLEIGDGEFKDTSEVLRSSNPQPDLKYGVWLDEKCDVKAVSALAVMFAVQLRRHVDCPVAIINTAMGGLSIDSYISKEYIDSDDDLKIFLKKIGKYVADEKDYHSFGMTNYTVSSGVYNDKIAPLSGLNVEGFVWYLGESAAWDFSFATAYKTELLMLIKEMRQQFGNTLPVTLINIAQLNYDYGDGLGYLYVNEAMSIVSKMLPRVYNVPIYDILPRWNLFDGDRYFHAIHTVNKEPVALRAYDLAVVKKHTAPFIKGVEKDGERLICHVETFGEKLKEGNVFGFSISNGLKYYPATAAVKDNMVIVYSPDCKEPQEITYAFFNYNYLADLKTISGLVVEPFRSKIESADKSNYYFAPPYTDLQTENVYENNFGYDVGLCGFKKLWCDGVINCNDNCKLSVKNGILKITALPSVKSYYFFGVSPDVTVAGSPSQLDKYDYLNFEISTDSETEFCGMLIRLCDGSIYKCPVMVDEKADNSIKLSGGFVKISVCLIKAYRCDSALIELDKEKRSRICAVELLFRAEGKRQVKIKNICLSDLSASTFKNEEKKSEQITRADAVLPSKNA